MLGTGKVTGPKPLPMMLTIWPPGVAALATAPVRPVTMGGA